MKEEEEVRSSCWFVFELNLTVSVYCLTHRLEIMGSYFSKDYYYTNEGKFNTTQSDEFDTMPKFRILQDDPRSISLGIVRTPIQVEATPKRPAGLIITSPPNIASTADPNKQPRVEKEDSVTTYHENTEKELELESQEVDNKLNKGEETKIETDERNFIIKSKTLVRRYLETNLDNFITTPSCEDSISTNEKATELESQSTAEANGAEMSSVSPCTVHTTTLLDVSDFVDDPSAVVTDNDDSLAGDSETMNISINTWLAQMEQEMSCCSLSEDISPQKSVDDLVLQSDETSNKKLFSTPDVKTSSPAKVRTPLQEMKKNLLVESPSLIIKRKQWRCIQEERVKRGLSLDDENTPPPMPPFSNVPASAPGKMMHKRRIAEWDKESTVFI